MLCLVDTYTTDSACVSTIRCLCDTSKFGRSQDVEYYHQNSDGTCSKCNRRVSDGCARASSMTILFII